MAMRQLPLNPYPTLLQVGQGLANAMGLSLAFRRIASFDRVTRLDSKRLNTEISLIWSNTRITRRLDSKRRPSQPNLMERTKM